MPDDLTAADLAIEALADDSAALREQVAAYRELALAAVTQLGEMQRQIEKWQAKHKALVDEIRRYTQSKVT